MSKNLTVVGCFAVGFTVLALLLYGADRHDSPPSPTGPVMTLAIIMIIGLIQGWMIITLLTATDTPLPSLASVLLFVASVIMMLEFLFGLVFTFSPGLEVSYLRPLYSFGPVVQPVAGAIVAIAAFAGARRC